MFTAVLSTIAKTWKKPKCPSTEKWIKKMWYINTTKYYSAIKKNEVMSFTVTWMDLQITLLSKPGRDKYYTIHMWSIRSTNKLIYKIKTDLQT